MIRVVLVLFVLNGIYNASGQGCSDAGACSAGSLGLNESSQNETRFWMGYNQSVGLADKESLVLSTDLTINHKLFPNTGLEVRVPYLVTIGNLGTTSGLGDLLVSLSQVVVQEEKSVLSIVAGGRIKANESDKEIDGEPLPMVYQSSLGTNDIFTGIAWHSGDWSLSLAYQHPFGSNENEYLRPDSIDIPENKQYFESAFLKRGDDLVLRFQRSFAIQTAGQLVTGILPVYRIQQDEIRRNGNYEKLPGSDGITINLYFNWLRQIDENKQFNISTAFPVYTRKYRADGLTRTAIVSAGLVFKFRQASKTVEPIQGLFIEMEN
jgi:hypothetical protein